jgi:hypothetical protein
MGFPLERGSIEDGILTCHWHHARFDLKSGCTFDLWADDVPIFPVELRDGEVWVKTTFGDADPAAHWRQRLADGLAHLGLVIAKALHGQLATDAQRGMTAGVMLMDVPSREFVLAGSVEELKAKGRILTTTVRMSAQALPIENWLRSSLIGSLLHRQ